MKSIVFIIGLLLPPGPPDPLPAVVSGTLQRIENFPSTYVDPRTIDVWLPEGYAASRRYPVIYMHDGNMLFDSSATWNRQEWQVDEVMTRMRREEGLPDCIVVGIWNNGRFRRAEYFPDAILDSVPAASRNWILPHILELRARGNDYLSFLVMELKPYIDSLYATLPGAEHTFVMGSSRGGLISLYALCEYPDVFGGAACLSIHWPIVEPMTDDPRNADIFATAFRSYLITHLPAPGERKIYYDVGTLNLDSSYGRHQAIMDSLMNAKGFTGRKWMSRIIAGGDHTERSWTLRLPAAFDFLLRDH
jgi:hypothetical protein